MKLSDFVLLSEKEKQHAVLHQGVLIGKRREAASMIFLFQVEHFYVETSFDAESKDIQGFFMFDQTALLQPYLQSISLEGLLN